MKKFSKIAAILAAGSLLFGGLFLSCSDDDDDDDDPVLTAVVAGGSATVKKGENFTVTDSFHVYAYWDNVTGTYSEPNLGSKAKDVTKDATFKTSDGTEIKVNEAVTLDAGSHPLTVTYGGKTADDKITLVVTSSSSTTDETPLEEVAAGWTGSVTGGAFFTVFASSEDVKLESGKALTTTFKVTAVNTDGKATNDEGQVLNFKSAPNVLLRDSTKTSDGEYACVRADNYGWGKGYNAAGLDSDWDWDNFVSYVNGSTVKVTVKNYGTGKADVLYDFEKDGTKHHQYFKGITVTADDLNVNLVLEYCDVTFSGSSSSSVNAAWDFTGNARDGNNVDGISSAKGGTTPESPCELTTNKTGSGATMTVLTDTKSMWNGKLQFATGDSDKELFTITADEACTAVINVSSASSSKTAGKVNALKLGETVIFDFDSVDAVDEVEKTVSLAKGENKFTGSGVSIHKVTLK